jgi:hypothetical protein
MSYSWQHWPTSFGVDLKKEFDADKGYYYRDLGCVQLLLLRFVDIADRNQVFRKLGCVLQQGLGICPHAD